MKKKLLAFSLIFMLVFTMAACGGGGAPATGGGDEGGFDGQTHQWRSQTFTPTGTLYHEIHTGLANRIRDMSGGRIDIQTFGSGEIVAAGDGPNAIRDGILDSGIHATSVWTIEHGAPLFSSTPGLFSSPFDYWFWMEYGGGYEIWREMVGRYNMQAFIGAVFHQENFLWSNTKLETVADIQNLSIRMMPLGGEILSNNGVAVVFLPGGEIVPSIERNVIDAGEYSSTAMDVTLGFHDVAKYYHKPGWHQPTLMLEFVINGNSWAALSPDLQSIVENACRAHAIDTMMYSAVRDVAAEEQIKANGNEMVILSDEFIATLNGWAEIYWAEVEANDPFIKRIRDSQKNFMQWWVPNKALMNVEYPDWVWDRKDDHPYALVPKR